MYKPLLGFHYNGDNEGDRDLKRLGEFPWNIKWKV